MIAPLHRPLTHHFGYLPFHGFVFSPLPGRASCLFPRLYGDRSAVMVFTGLSINTHVLRALIMVIRSNDPL